MVRSAPARVVLLAASATLASGQKHVTHTIVFNHPPPAPAEAVEEPAALPEADVLEASPVPAEDAIEEAESQEELDVPAARPAVQNHVHQAIMLNHPPPVPAEDAAVEEAAAPEAPAAPAAPAQKNHVHEAIMLPPRGSGVEEGAAEEAESPEADVPAPPVPVEEAVEEAASEEAASEEAASAEATAEEATAEEATVDEAEVPEAVPAPAAHTPKHVQHTVTFNQPPPVPADAAEDEFVLAERQEIEEQQSLDPYTPTAQEVEFQAMAGQTLFGLMMFALGGATVGILALLLEARNRWRRGGAAAAEPSRFDGDLDKPMEGRAASPSFGSAAQDAADGEYGDGDPDADDEEIGVLLTEARRRCERSAVAADAGEMGAKFDDSFGDVNPALIV